MTKFIPTEEQIEALELFNKENVLKIKALAGSGKSSTLKFIAESHPEMNFLYVAFNKSMAQEAATKFPQNVNVMTVHSLAYRNVGKEYSHKLVRPSGRYINMAGTGSEIAQYYGIFDMKDSNGATLTKAYLGLIVKDTVNAFERSSDKKITDKHIPGYHLKDIKKRFNLKLNKVVKEIMSVSKKLWEDRCDVNERVLCTHDTYLRIYELSQPKLTQYDCILIDESQDSSEVMLSLFTQQKCKLVFCGDEKQNIYGWRGSVNAMNKIQGAESKLTKSFRFGQEIADIANVITGEDLKGLESIKSIVGEIDPTKPYTVLYRKNITLIFEALDMIARDEKVYLNIDVRDFVLMLESALHLFNKQIKKVKHESIIPYATWKDLCNEAKSDPSMGKLVKIITEGRAQEVINNLNFSQKDANSADVILTTAHKAKGLEWDQVILADDFKSSYDKEGKLQSVDEEENNLLYVACTRAKKVLKPNSVVEEKLTIKGIPINYKVAHFGVGDSESIDQFFCDEFGGSDNYMQAYDAWNNEEYCEAIAEGAGNTSEFLGEIKLMPDLNGGLLSRINHNIHMIGSGDDF